LGLDLPGSFTKEAKAFNACAPNHGRAHVTWTSAGGKIKDVRVKAGTRAIEECIAKTMATIQAGPPGRCGITLVL
jgi:hypothetical protein